MSLAIPKHGTSSRKICLAIHTAEKAVTVDEGIALHGIVIGHSRYDVEVKYGQMVKTGYLVQIGDNYQLSRKLQQFFCESKPQYSAPKVENIAPPRTPAPFKELTGYTLNPHGTRGVSDQPPDYSRRENFQQMSLAGSPP